MPRRTSDLGVTATGEKRIMELTRMMNAQVYLTHEKYRTVLQSERLPDIRVRFVNWDSAPYHQQYGSFIAGLNILDLLFNEGIAFTRERLQRVAQTARLKLFNIPQCG
jgi:hypothetical protein